MNITIQLLTHDGRALSLVATPGDSLMRAATRAMFFTWNSTYLI